MNEAGGKRYSALEHKVVRSRLSGKAVIKDFELSGLEVRLVMAKNHKNSEKEPVISAEQPASQRKAYIAAIPVEVVD